MGLERAHAQRLGEGEGLAVVAYGWLGLGGRLARRALAEEPQCPGLVAALLILAGELERLRGALGLGREPDNNVGWYLVQQGRAIVAYPSSL